MEENCVKYADSMAFQNQQYRTVLKIWWKLVLRFYEATFAEALEKYRAQITEEYITSWFGDLKSFLIKSNAATILEDPSRILNGNESGFRLCPKTGKVLGVRGPDGRLCPPLVIFPYVKPQKNLVDHMPPDWILGKSDSGWMRSEVFYEYVANELNKWLEREQIQRPVLFLKVLQNPKMSNNMKNGFKACGLYPFNPNAVNYKKCVQNVLEKLSTKTVKVHGEISEADIISTEKVILKFKPELSEFGFCTNTILTLVKSLIPKMSDGSGVSFFTPEEIDEMEVVFADDTSTTESEALSKVSDQNSGVVIIQDILLNPRQRKQNSENLVQCQENLEREKPSEISDDELEKPDKSVLNGTFARKEDDDKFQEIEKINLTEEKIKTGEIEQIEKSIIYEERLQTENTLQDVESEKPNLKQERVRTTKEIIKLIVDGDNLDEEKIVQEKQVAEESTSLEKEKIIIDSSETQPVTEKTNFKKEQPERDHRLSKRTDKGITKPTINDKHLEEEKIIQEQTMTESASLRNEKNNSPNPIDRVKTEPVIEQASSSFEKHLSYPQPLNKNPKKRQREKIPSAISSTAWRKYYEDKLKEKEEKENAKKKRKNADNLDQEAGGSSMRDNETEVEIDDQKNQHQSIFKQKCGECEEELESDAEIETEKKCRL
ncbi:hypothetical protein NQ314_002040 [Rhamnusium bicolor]|uniref:DDE-1 domain-containing protein n=1 Tax=Rhamnusium bicolor TaxID=1586634 RepID=A0AAV8ZSX3_9CUCU|nr:hypothetical protein NQ314_002040 [Rhamnusium bicolor]